VNGGIGLGELLTSGEVAERLKVSLRFVRRLVAERRIEYVKVGRSVRFAPEAVADYVERNKVVPIDRTKLRRYLREVA
jgi:excisionase family DNA binding protein